MDNLANIAAILIFGGLVWLVGECYLYQKEKHERRKQEKDHE